MRALKMKSQDADGILEWGSGSSEDASGFAPVDTVNDLPLPKKGRLGRLCQLTERLV